MHQGIKNIILTLNHKPTAPQYQALFGFSYSSELKLRELSHIWSTRYSTRCPPVVPNPVLSALHCRNRVGITTTMTKNLVLNFSSKVTPWCDMYWVTSQSDSLFFRSMEEHTQKNFSNDFGWERKRLQANFVCANIPERGQHLVMNRFLLLFNDDPPSQMIH